MYYLSDRGNSIVSRKWHALKTNFWVLPGNHTCNQLSCLFCTSERQQLAVSPGVTNQYRMQLLALPYRKMTWLRWNLKAQDRGGATWVWPYLVMWLYLICFHPEGTSHLRSRSCMTSGLSNRLQLILSYNFRIMWLPPQNNNHHSI